MLYRIFTEDKGNVKEIAKLASRYFEGFTIFKSLGYYKGKAEKSLLIEVTSLDENICLDINDLADDIKVVNKQETVLVEKIACSSKLI